jgi:hypothetical protein
MDQSLVSCVSVSEAQMVALLIIFTAGLFGYFNGSPLAWPATALALALISWHERYTLARRGAALGLDDAVTDALLRSSANALIATGACYWAGVLLRSLSGL